jgi:hypothetical protein
MYISADLLLAIAVACLVIPAVLWAFDIITETIRRACYREPKHNHISKSSEYDTCPKCRDDLARTMTKIFGVR